MRTILTLAVAATAGLGLLGVAPAQAAPSEANHGQCVSSSPQPAAKGGRSATAKDKAACTPPAPLTCTTNGTASRDSAANTVTVTGQVGSAGSSLECATAIPVTGGVSTITFDYAITDGAACGGGVPRLFVVIDGVSGTENTINSDPECSGQGTTGSVTYTIQSSGNVSTVGFVYDRDDNGTVVYSNATVGGVVLDV